MAEPLTSIREYTPAMQDRVMAGLRLLSNCLGSYKEDLVLVQVLVPVGGRLREPSQRGVQVDAFIALASVCLE